MKIDIGVINQVRFKTIYKTQNRCRGNKLRILYVSNLFRVQIKIGFGSNEKKKKKRGKDSLISCVWNILFKVNFDLFCEISI